MPEWILPILAFLGISRLWRGVRRVASWLKPAGLARGGGPTMVIAETAWRASGDEIQTLIVRLILGNPDKSAPQPFVTFRLDVGDKAPFYVSEARLNEERGNWFLVPAGGGFSSIPNKPYLSMPVDIPSDSGVDGWVGFTFIENHKLTLVEAREVDAWIVGIQPNGREIQVNLPPCELPLP